MRRSVLLVVLVALLTIGPAVAEEVRPPEVQSGAAFARGPQAMTVSGVIHPHGQYTRYHFEYGETAEYGQKSESFELPPRLAAYYFEDWNAGSGGWQSWNGGHRTEPGERGGYLFFTEPSNHDHNHDDGIGTLHLCKYLYPGPINHSLFFGRGDPDFRDARVSLFVRGRDWAANGAELCWWTQSQSNMEVGEGPTWLRANWAYTGYLLTDKLSSGKWEQVEYRLKTDPAEWTYAGNNHKQPNKERYTYWPITDSQQHLNCDFFHLLAYIDTRNPPRGAVEFDDIALVYRNHSLLLESNGGKLTASPTGAEGEKPESLTDGWRTGKGKTWRSAANPAAPLEFVYTFERPVTIEAVQLHQHDQWLAKEVEVLASAEGEKFEPLVKTMLPDRGDPNFNWAFSLNRGLKAKATALKVRILSGYRAEHWGLGEIEIYGTGARKLPENEPTPVTLDLEKLTPGKTYHWRLVAVTDAGATPGKDQTFAMPVDARPVVTTGKASRVTGTSAKIEGRLNPMGLMTKFHFEYGPDVNYGSKTPEAHGGTQETPRSSFATLTGLKPGQKYHYRLVAVNEKGTSQGEDAVVETTEAK